MKKIKKYIRFAIMRIFSGLKLTKRKTVYFSSFSSRQYSDSPKAISELIHHRAPEINIIWTLSRDFDGVVPDYVKVVRSRSLRNLILMAQADAWVLNSIVQEGTYKNKNTLYLQTWHGDRAFKQIGLDAYRSMGAQYKTQKPRFLEPLICDFFTVGSTFGEKMMQSAFGYNGKLLKFGTPRNDLLIKHKDDKKLIEELKQRLGIDVKTRILLYAPTFRDKDKHNQNTKINFRAALDTLTDTGDSWVCLVRAHSLSDGINISSGIDSRIMDVSHYGDMAELLLMCDCLITDYSSSAQDYILTGRPVILTEFDEEKYTHESRSLYYQPSKIGFIIAKSQTELEKELKDVDSVKHRNIDDRIKQFYGMYETGAASDAAASVILEHLGELE